MQTHSNTPLVINLFWKQKLGGDTQKYKEGLIKAKSMQRAVQGNLNKLPEHTQTKCELVSEKHYVSFQDDTEIMGDGKYQLFAKGGKEISQDCATQTIDDLWNNFLQVKEKFTPEERKEFSKLFVAMRDALNIGEQYDLFRNLKLLVDTKQGKDGIALDLDHVARKLENLPDNIINKKKTYNKYNNPLKNLKKQINKVKTLGYNSYEAGDKEGFCGDVSKAFDGCLLAVITCGQVNIPYIDNGLIIAKKEAHKDLSILVKKFNEGYQKTLTLPTLPQKIQKLKKDNRFLFLILNHKNLIEKLITDNKETNSPLAFTVQQIYNSAIRKLDDFLHCDIYMPSVGMNPKKRIGVGDNLEHVGEINPWEGVLGIKKYKDIQSVKGISAKKMFDTQSNNYSLTWQPQLIDRIEPSKIDNDMIKEALQEIKHIVAQARRFNMAYEV